MTQFDQVRVGFIGAGRISDLHAAEYLANPNAEIVAVCDNNIEIAQAQAAKWGIPGDRVFTEYRGLLDCKEVDLVEILVPHFLHFEIASAAIDAGKALSLQKPMTLNTNDADRLIELAANKNVSFKVFENFIFYPPVMKAKQLIEDGEIGEPLTIRIKSNPGKSKTAWAVPAAAQKWRANESMSGGGPLTFDDGHHKFALAWHFMGMPESVHGWISHTEASDGFLFDAPAMFSWKYPNETYGNLEVVYSPELEIETVHYAQDDRVEITGTKGVIWITRGHGRIGDQAPVILYRDGQTFAFSNIATDWGSSFIESTRHYINALREGLPPKLTGREGREILSFALAAQEAAKTGSPVSLGLKAE